MKKLLAILLAVLMLVTVFAGCGDSETSSSENSESSIVESKWPSGYPFKEGAFAGKTLYIWTGETRTESNEAFYKEFEDATGAKIELTAVPYGDGLAPYSTAITSGGNIDFLAPDARQFPTWAIKKLLNPLNTVIDLENDEIVKNSPNKPLQAFTDFTTYKGEAYGFQPYQPSPSYIIYRKSVLEEAGLDDPYELWQNGKWTFDTMKDLLADLTYDSDEDGLVDKYGITGYLDSYWIGTAGGDANYVRYDEEGRPQFAIDDPDIVESYEFYRELQRNDYYCTITSPMIDFISGDFAMYGGMIAWDRPTILEEIGIEDLGYVPFPASPSNESGITNTQIHHSYYSVASSVKENNLLAEWIRYKFFWQRADALSADEAFQKKLNDSFGGSKEWYDFEQKLIENVWIPNGDCFGLVGSMCNSEVFWKEEESILNLVTAVAPACQAEINSVFYDLAE